MTIRQWPIRIGMLASQIIGVMGKIVLKCLSLNTHVDCGTITFVQIRMNTFVKYTRQQIIQKFNSTKCGQKANVKLVGGKWEKLVIGSLHQLIQRTLTQLTLRPGFNRRLEVVHFSMDRLWDQFSMLVFESDQSRRSKGMIMNGHFTR